MKNLFTAVLILFCCVPIFAQNDNPFILRGNVTDSLDLPIENAKVTIISDAGKNAFCKSDKSGNFACETDFEGKFLLTVEAEGFSILRQNFTNKQEFILNNVFTLLPATIQEEIIVTANRIETRLSETPASVVTLSKTELDTTAAPTIDDALKQVPGFSLFRRSGSRTANPTAQGVSLRGTGASGAGRSLVLFDGVPLNDVFGGWTQWSRIPPVAVERIEVLRGGASSLYGNDSLSGTINIIPRGVREKYAFSAEVYAGTQKTFSASTFFGFAKNDWTADFVWANFQTEGYVDIEKSVRGSADIASGSRNSNFSGKIGRNLGETANVFFKTTYFGEARSNGTDLQKNRTHIRQFIVGGDWELSDLTSRISDLFSNSKFNWRVFGGTQVFDQTFSAVGDDRNGENLVRLQRVPAQNFGFSGNFSTVVGANQTLSVGFDGNEVRGASDETGFFGGRATSKLGAGGKERTYGFFVQDFARIGSRIVLIGSLRYDDWKNFDALSSVRTLSTNVVNTTEFPARRENSLSPQVSFLYQITDNFSFHALASRSFRAPTLNELYRGFRVGDVVTNPNENLRAEKASNFETGASFGKNDFYLRGNFFYTEISDPIANVTLSVSNLIIRQRQNIGKTRNTGVEIEAEKRWREFNFSAGYLFTNSVVKEFSANQNLEGLKVPQVASNQFTFQTRYAKSGWSLALQGRAIGEQFDDDLNLFRLEPFFQLDVFAAKKFEKLQIFVGIENIFNSRYSTGKTPIRTLSSPINGRIGIRWN